MIWVPKIKSMINAPTKKNTGISAIIIARNKQPNKISSGALSMIAMTIATIPSTMNAPTNIANIGSIIY